MHWTVRTSTAVNALLDKHCKREWILYNPMAWLALLCAVPAIVVAVVSVQFLPITMARREDEEDEAARATRVVHRMALTAVGFVLILLAVLWTVPWPAILAPFLLCSVVIWLAERGAGTLASPSAAHKVLPGAEGAWRHP